MDTNVLGTPSGMAVETQTAGYKRKFLGLVLRRADGHAHAAPWPLVDHASRRAA